MSLSVDEIIAQRTLRRKLGFWRLASLALLGLAVLVAFGWAGMFSSKQDRSGDHVASVNISGVILSDPEMLTLLEELGENDQVKAVIINMSSPGGTTVGGEELYYAMRKLSKIKPVATNVGTLAASAGYMIAIGTDYIVARRTSIVGSIGVLFQYADASKLLDTIGVKVETVKSAPLKAEPSPFHPASEEARAMVKRVIDDTFDWFKGLVVERRAMSVEKVNRLADGSIFTGQQALDEGLIDAIGDQENIIGWLEREKNISSGLKVLEWEPARNETLNWGSSSLLHWFARQIGISTDTASFELMKKIVAQEHLLDGLVSRMITFNPEKQ